MERLDCVRNALMLATICGGVPAVARYVVGLEEMGPRARARTWQMAVISLSIPFCLSLSAAVIGLFHPPSAYVVFVLASVSLVLISVMWITFWFLPAQIQGGFRG